MDISGRFFSKLRMLALQLEEETADLQHTHTHTQEDGSDVAVKVLHELHTEARELKAQVLECVDRSRREDREMRTFMQACVELKQRVTEDLQSLRRHYEKYGYRAAVCESHTREVKGEVEAEGADGVVTKEENDDDEDEDENESADEGKLCPHTPAQAPPTEDPLRTPRLSDFGLSGFQARWADVVEPVLPTMPQTPKCTLHMDEDTPTSHLGHFGITEYTMSLNTDFTMDLLRKNPAMERSKLTQNRSSPPPTSVSWSLGDAGIPACSAAVSPVSDFMVSPEPPVFCTPAFNITKKPAVHSNPELTPRPVLQKSPEVPLFETPYLKSLISTLKPQKDCEDSVRLQPIAFALGDQESFTNLHGDEKTPERPNVQRSAGIEDLQEPTPPSMDSSDWTHATPAAHSVPCWESQTPEMPDFSSYTHNIITMISQSNTMRADLTCTKSAAHCTGKENRPRVLSAVSEEEFLQLPSYLRLFSLSSLNQMVLKINAALAERLQGGVEARRFHVDELQQMAGAGVKSHLYVLCLTELKRLQCVTDDGSNSVYTISHA